MARLASLVLMVTFMAGCSNGSPEAEHDISQGHLELRTFGLPAPWEVEYARLLKERHGIELNAVAGCVVTEDLMRDVERYNAVMEVEIKQRFGSDVLDRVAEDARQNWDKQHADAP